MKVVKTICQACYFYCGLDVTVDHGRIVRIDGMKEHPVNRGTICPKGIAAQQLVTDPKRLQYPLLRVGHRGSGRWKRISWDEAIKLLASKILEAKERYGPESVAYHRGHAPGWVTTMNYVTRFMNTFGSPNLVTHAHLCYTPRAIAHVATYGGVPEADFDHAKSILLWGFNPVYTSLPNYARRIIEAKTRGTKLIVVDPRFSPTAAKADIWLQPIPGTDIYLALGMAKVIVEEDLYDKEFVRDWTVGFDALCEHLDRIDLREVARVTGVAVEDFSRAARVFATERPATLKEGNGLDQQANVTQTVRAIALLPALVGSLNVKGGNILMPRLPFVDVQARGILPSNWEERSISTHPLYFRQGNAVHDEELFSALATGKPYPIKVLIVQGGALLSANSNFTRTKELLKRLDFIAVHDLYMTAIAELADLVLPATSFLERNLLLYYRYRPNAWTNMVGLQQQAVSPVGESRSDLDFLFELAQQVGLREAFPWESVEEAFNWELRPLGITIDYLRDHPEGYIKEYTPQELYRTHGRTGFPTRSGKVELYSKQFEEFGYDPLPNATPLPETFQPSEEYPLLCGTCLKLGIHTHTQFRTLPWIYELEPDPFLEIHPDQAESLGIGDGDLVRVESKWGEVTAIARLSEGVPYNVVMLTYGYGQPYTGGPWKSVNYITTHVDPDPISGATSNRRIPVRVVREESRGGERPLALLINLERCVGCRTCELACLQEHGQKRIRVNTLGPTKDDKGRMVQEFVPLILDSCDLCQERLRKGEAPACLSACPAKAIVLVSLSEAARLISGRRYQLMGVRKVSRADGGKEERRENGCC